MRSVRTVAVVMPEAGKFAVTLVPGEAQYAVAAGAGFGVVGALVAVGVVDRINAIRDRRTTTRVAPQLTDWSPGQHFLKSFEAAFRDAGRESEVTIVETEPTGPDRQRHDAIVLVRLIGWGLKEIALGRDKRLTGFARIQTRMTRTQDGLAMWDEDNVVLGQRRARLDEYERNAEMLRDALQEVVESAAYQTATVLLFPREKTK